MNLENSIAVLGMAVRTSGASDANELWELIRRGQSSYTCSISARQDHIPLKNPIADYDRFDATFFGFGEREAEVLDPQRRMLFETVWHAFEDAAQVPGMTRTGTFMSVSQSEYFLLHLGSRPDLFDTLGGMLLGVSNGQDFAATQLAYKLDLRGPALNINTACSGSLVAVHAAISSLLAFECDLAVAGGASIALAHSNGYFYKEGGINSRSGACRPFDACADGTIPGSGIVSLVLKRLDEALRDGDPIRAVIRGSAVNNDGSAKVGFTAPSMVGQIEVIREALAVAGIVPDAVDFLETHGTGTALGDALEFSALQSVFGQRNVAVPPLRLGALKANIGHANSAAGACGLVKVILGLQRDTIPALAHFVAPSEGIGLHTALQIPRAAMTWPVSERPRVAGVSSFGIGGTNAHVIIEEAPPESPRSESSRPHIFTYSARSATALDAVGRRLVDDIVNTRYPLADIAYTLAAGRMSLPLRRAVVASNREGLLTQLRAQTAPSVTDGVGSIAWMFSGQGEECVSALSSLYQMEPVFRASIDRCRDVLSMIDCDWYYSFWNEVLAGAPLSIRYRATDYQQPLLFAFALSQARLFESWGLRPTVVLGHSLGEYAAACVAGLMSLEDALRLVHVRATAMQATAPGAMIGVLLDSSAAEALASEFAVDVAACNGDAQHVLAGGEAEISKLEQACVERGIAARRLSVDRGFHSRLMDHALVALEQASVSIQSGRLRTPFVSGLDGRWCEAGDLGSADYWVAHARQPVAFRQCLDTLQARKIDAVVEIGPGNALSRLAQRHYVAHSITETSAALRVMALQDSAADPVTFTYQRLASLWASGQSIDWNAYYAHESRAKVHLSGYPFERQRYWIERATHHAHAAENSDWFYRPILKVWSEAAPVSVPDVACWLLLDDATRSLDALHALLQAQGATVHVVRAGGADSDDEFGFDVDDRREWGRLAAWLDERKIVPDHYVYSWQLAKIDRPHRDLMNVVKLARISHDATRGGTSACLTVLCQNATPTLPSERAMLSGLLRVLPQELAGLRTRFLTITPECAWREAFPALCSRQAYLDLRLTEVLHEQGYEAAVDVVDPAMDFCANGRYLIVGGLGKVGRKLTNELSQEMPLRLALVGRTELDPDSGADIVDLVGDGIDTTAAMALAAPCDVDRQESQARDHAHRQLHRLSVAVVLDYTRECGLEFVPGTCWKLNEIRVALCTTTGLLRIVDTMLRVLVEAEIIEITDEHVHVICAGTNYSSVDESRRSIEIASPDYNGAAQRLLHCASAFRQVLHEGTSGVSVLYPDGSADFLSATATSGIANADFEAAVKTLRRVIGELVDRAEGRTIRILEFGGGNGTVTRQLVPLLETLPVQYCFTDIGPSFVKGARRLADENGYHWLSTGTLDISRDPLEQGFVAGEFDLVFGYNVLHIAPDLEQAIARLTTLVQPRGALAVMETMRWMPWLELVWGLTEDWWRFEDTTVRRDSPLLSVEAWRRLFKGIGFGTVEVSAGSNATDALVLATVPPSSLRQHMLSQNCSYNERCSHVRTLVQRGVSVVYYRADVSDVQQMRRLGEDLQHRYGSLDGVVYTATTGMRGMSLLDDFEQHRFTDEFAAKCTGLDHLVPVCKLLEPKFVAVMSSMSSVLGGVGHVAYATANSYQDAWCRARAGQSGPTRWLALNWDAWGDAGQSFGASVAQHQMSEKEAVSALRHALTLRHDGQLLISRSSLEVRLGQWLQREVVYDGNASERPCSDRSTSLPQEVGVQVIELWRELLGRQLPVDLDSNFLTLGGDSLQAVQMISLIQRRFGRQVSLGDFVREPTVSNLVHLITREERAWSPLVTLNPGLEGLPLYCVHPGGGGIQCYRELAHALGPTTSVYALQSRQFGPEQLALHRSIYAMAEDYRRHIEMVHRGGPLVLLGYCFGGLVAFEIACQLEAAGLEVARLVLVDSHPPGVDDGFLDQRNFIEAQISSSSLMPAPADWLDRVAALPPEAQAKALCDRIDWSHADSALQPLAARIVLDMILSNIAKNEYIPTQILQARVHLMRIDDQAFHRQSNMIHDLGWSQFCATPVDVSWLKGKHDELFNAEQVVRVAERLRELR